MSCGYVKMRQDNLFVSHDAGRFQCRRSHSIFNKESKQEMFHIAYISTFTFKGAIISNLIKCMCHLLSNSYI